MRLLRRGSPPTTSVESYADHLTRLGYEVVGSVDTGNGHTVVEFTGRVDGVVLLLEYRDYLLEDSSVRVRTRDGRLHHLRDPELRRARRGPLSRPDLVGRPYPTAADYRRLVELRAGLDRPLRSAYVDTIQTPESRTAAERTALFGWDSLDPDDVSGATDLLLDLASGAPVEWVLRRARPA